MTALGYMSSREALVGWRVWRVLPFRRLDGSSTVRLCAVGTLGVPKLWEPRRETVAVCSSHVSHHEAPWPDHECGVWAVKRPEDARRPMVSWMQTQGGDPVGWAMGRVSLWGRVIEHAHGFRAQYAYPYALTIESDNARVCDVLRAEYAIDVEWAGGELFTRAIEKRAEADRVRAEQQRAERARELAEIRASLRAEPRVPPRSAWQVFYNLTAADLVGVLEGAGRALSSREIVELVASDNEIEVRRPNSYVGEVAQKLKAAAMTGTIVQLRRAGHASRWALPGMLAPEGWSPAVDRHAAFDEEVYAAFKATLSSSKAQAVRTRDVLAYQGRPDATLSEKVHVAHALSRLVQRGRVRWVSTRAGGYRGGIASWALPEGADNA